MCFILIMIAAMYIVTRTFIRYMNIRISNCKCAIVHLSTVQTSNDTLKLSRLGNKQTPGVGGFWVGGFGVSRGQPCKAVRSIP